MTLAFDLILCLMIVGTAAAALLTHNALAAIVFFIVFGNLLGLAWLAMNAVNVAMAEIAIGAGITGVLLILTRQRLMALGDDLVSAETPGWLRAGAVLACTGLTALVGSAVLSVAPADDLGGPIAALLPELGIENPVTGVLLAFRAYDTLLETFVLLGALVAVWSLAPGNAWPRPPASLNLAESGGEASLRPSDGCSCPWRW
ncbi:hydrogenase subunit MbhD domain-containing protein [Brevundimonas diminuta]|uniref:hydrogenase subunit MbhD domain-containing protein n=1 Tax=Brevundimonas diminuta TaxID=293 RepID=UPI003D9A4188